jgi:hypothetical protein
MEPSTRDAGAASLVGTFVDALLTLSLFFVAVVWSVATYRLADRHDAEVFRAFREAQECTGCFMLVPLVGGGVLLASVFAMVSYALLRRSRSRLVSYTWANAGLVGVAGACYLLLGPAWL